MSYLGDDEQLDAHQWMHNSQGTNSKLVEQLLAQQFLSSHNVPLRPLISVLANVKVPQLDANG